MPNKEGATFITEEGFNITLSDMHKKLGKTSFLKRFVEPWFILLYIRYYEKIEYLFFSTFNKLPDEYPKDLNITLHNLDSAEHTIKRLYKELSTKFHYNMRKLSKEMRDRAREEFEPDVYLHYGQICKFIRKEFHIC